MQEIAFTEAYNRLNIKQKEAVDTIEGPVMVLAGPGTGKTQILTLRIARILKNTDVTPENILALTFTESGAKAMRERLSRYIGASAYRVAIHTFHEFAGKLIRQYPDAYTRVIGGRLMDDLEKVILVESIIATPTIKNLRPSGNPEYYIKPIISALSEMKREYITPDIFAEHIEAQQVQCNAIQKIHEKGAHKGKVRKEYLDAEKKIVRNKELLFVYRAYEAELALRRVFDFEDMIYETVRALETNEDMLRSVQEEYQYILADEHQDVNGSQNRILELLASFHEYPNIFVVGDEKQSIYRFQGASLENFLYFEEKFPHVKTIALTENYRSLQGILDFSHELITTVPSPASELRIPLNAHQQGSAQIEMRSVSHEAIEHAYLTESIQSHIDSGTSSDEIAVIVRTNQEVEIITTLLRKHGIEAEASVDSDILTHPLMYAVRTLIRMITTPYDERALFEVLQSSYVDLSIADIVRIARARSYATPLADILGDRTYLNTLGIKDITKVEKIMHVCTHAREQMLIEPPHRLLEYSIREIGLLDHVLATNPYDGVHIIRRLYDEVEEMVCRKNTVTLADIETMFATRVSHGLALTVPHRYMGKHAVRVMTAHKSKGLEFTYVYIPHLTDASWGGKRHTHLFNIPVTKHINVGMFDDSEDERKLLYVALTRAKKGIFMSMSKISNDGRTMLASRFLEDMNTIHSTQIDMTDVENIFNPSTVFLETQTEKSYDIVYIQETLKERGLSVTALNNYLRDPWNYFYRNVLRIPDVQSESAQFGTILHNTLQHVCVYRRTHNGTSPSSTELKKYIEYELGKIPIHTNEYVRFHERAFLALTHYLEYTRNSFPKDTKEEYTIRAVLETGIPDFPEVLLTGKLDRLDFDAQGTLLRVVDYKTGTPKTRGEIEGTTKTATGDYKRQLVFYALLLQLHGHTQLQTREGLLSFIEADAKGVIHEELFVITDEEIEMLKGEIIRVVREITHGTFLNVPCDPKKCDYALLVAEIQSRFIA